MSSAENFTLHAKLIRENYLFEMPKTIFWDKLEKYVKMSSVEMFTQHVKH